MTKTDTRDTEATIAQVRSLEEAGAQLIRLAVPDQEAAMALLEIKRSARVPLVADIHFNYRLALVALEAGVDKLRINPGNIGGRRRVETVAKAAAARGVPIRIGVNAGSLEKDLLEKYGHPTPEAMVESALRQAEVLVDLGFEGIVISLKASSVPATVAAYRLAAQRCDFPFHLGITEAGTPATGLVRSAAGMGILLAEGIGDTLRVSLTAPPEEEVRAGYALLSALNLRQHGITLISCPTCGRCQAGLAALVADVERRLARIDAPLTVAVMGCAVNGPGEAREADVGIALGKGHGLLFRGGQVVATLPEDELAEALEREVRAKTSG